MGADGETCKESVKSKKEAMTVQQKVRNLLSDASREVVNTFRTKESIQKETNAHLAVIRQGQLAEELVKSEGWTELLEPEMDKILEQASLDLEKDRSPYNKDDRGYYPRGIIGGLKLIKKYLNDKIEQAQTARQELSLLQKQERQDNAGR